MHRDANIVVGVEASPSIAGATSVRAEGRAQSEEILARKLVLHVERDRRARPIEAEKGDAEACLHDHLRRLAHPTHQLKTLGVDPVRTRRTGSKVLVTVTSASNWYILRTVTRTV